LSNIYQEFDLIITEFKNKVAKFESDNGLDKYAVQIELDGERKTGKICEVTTPFNVIQNISFFDDAEFKLVLPYSISKELSPSH